jgi:hypothetical protein
MNMFLAKTQGRDLVPIQSLGEIALQSDCR